PSQDVVLGNYYLTIETRHMTGEGKIFKDANEVQTALLNGDVHYHTRIGIAVDSMPNKPFKDDQRNKVMITSVGKVIFNEILPEDFPYLNEPTDDNLMHGVPDKYFLGKGEDIN